MYVLLLAILPQKRARSRFSWKQRLLAVSCARGQSGKALDRLDHAHIAEIVVTDSIALPELRVEQAILMRVEQAILM